MFGLLLPGEAEVQIPASASLVLRCTAPLCLPGAYTQLPAPVKSCWREAVGGRRDRLAALFLWEFTSPMLSVYTRVGATACQSAPPPTTLLPTHAGWEFSISFMLVGVKAQVPPPPNPLMPPWKGN